MTPEDRWAYDEPHTSGENCHVTMTRQQAVAWMLTAFPKYHTRSADDVFDDWKILHWAYREE